MSSLWRDELRLLLTPQRVYLRRFARPLGRIVHDEAVEANDHDGYHWAAAVEALAGLLPEASRRGTDAHVVLSNHFVRYCLVPADDMLVTREDQSRYAQHSFVRIHGPQAERWSVRVSGAPGTAAVASGIDIELVEVLQAALLARQARPRSLQPALMAAYNGALPKLPPGDLRLLVVEPGIAVSALRNGSWTRIRSQRLAEPPDGEIEHLLERERALDERAAENESVCVVPLLPQPVEVAQQGPQLRLLPPFWSAAAAPSTAAVAGVPA